MDVALSGLDSTRFGVTIARASDVVADDVPALAAFCREREVELVIARCSGHDQAAARALTAAGLGLLEAHITFRGPVADHAAPAGVRDARPGDRDAIAALARSGFGAYAGHYHADPRLPLEACRDVYVDWSLRALEGVAADAVFVAEPESVSPGTGSSRWPATS